MESSMHQMPARRLGFAVVLLASMLLGSATPISAQTTPTCTVDSLAAESTLHDRDMPGAPDAPPQPTPIELQYLADTAPYRDHLQELQDTVAGFQKMAASGEIDSIAIDDLGALTRDLFTAHQTFACAAPSVRLDRYDRTVQLGLERAYTAATLILRAQASESPPEQAALIRDAGTYSANSARLFKDAADELRAVLPVIAS
jgi:hypothetical protein